MFEGDQTLMSQNYRDILKQANEWVREVGCFARDRQTTAIMSRKDDRSPVTDIDHAVQDRLMELIARHYPNDAVIAEEASEHQDRHKPVAEAEHCWVIDPIDGTRNYAHGFPLFTVSVAVFAEGAPVIGLVYNPVSDLMYTAVAGQGATLNDRPIHVSDVPLGTDRFICIPSGREEALPPVVHQWIDRFVARSTGSTAMNLALVASGAADATISLKCRLWDMAAGGLIATEAGARVVTRDTHEPFFPMNLAEYQEDRTPFFAGSPQVLEELMTEFDRAQSTKKI
jgi:myo-inositol-1(or 4)-monophosphatase